jgi:predicted nuclease of predicted toxin-antitoxin system
MTLMRLKLDENLDVGLAVWLESLGHDAKTIRDEQMSGASDDEVFAAAAAEDRCLVTLDLDFSDPLRFAPAAGTIVLRVPVPSIAMIRRLLQQAITHATNELPTGQIWIVEAGRIRIWESWDIK